MTEKVQSKNNIIMKKVINVITSKKINNQYAIFNNAMPV